MEAIEAFTRLILPISSWLQSPGPLTTAHEEIDIPKLGREANPDKYINKSSSEKPKAPNDTTLLESQATPRSSSECPPGAAASHKRPSPAETVEERSNKRICQAITQSHSSHVLGQAEAGKTGTIAAASPAILPPSASTFTGPDALYIDIDRELRSRSEKHVKPSERDAAADNDEDDVTPAVTGHVRGYGLVTPPPASKVTHKTGAGTARYTFHEISTFARAAALMCDSKWIEGQKGRSQYPHTFRNDEQLDVDGVAPFSIFPLLAHGIWDGSQRVGPDRVVLDRHYQYSGIIRHGRRSFETPGGHFFLVK